MSSLCRGLTFDVDEVFKDINKNNNRQRNYRKYELLNEVINDYFSIKVADIYLSENDKIGKNENMVGGTSYSRAFPLLKDFIEENQDLLVKSRLSGDHQSFARFLGQENFDRLADCITQFLSFGDYERADIYGNIRSKAGINKIPELKDYKKFDCDWDEKEQVIVDSFKTVDEISEIARKRRKENANVEEQKIEETENE